MLNNVYNSHAFLYKNNSLDVSQRLAFLMRGKHTYNANLYFKNALFCTNVLWGPSWPPLTSRLDISCNCFQFAHFGTLYKKIHDVIFLIQIIGLFKSVFFFCRKKRNRNNVMRLYTNQSYQTTYELGYNKDERTTAFARSNRVHVISIIKFKVSLNEKMSL